MANKQFEKFDHLMREMLKASHSEIASKLKAEKDTKKRKKLKKSSASREV